MITQSMANYLYSLNERRSLYISKKNAFVLNMYNKAIYNNEPNFFESCRYGKC